VYEVLFLICSQREHHFGNVDQLFALLAELNAKQETHTADLVSFGCARNSIIANHSVVVVLVFCDVVM